MRSFHVRHAHPALASAITTLPQMKKGGGRTQPGSHGKKAASQDTFLTLCGPKTKIFIKCYILLAQRNVRNQKEKVFPEPLHLWRYLSVSL